jgi:hypothetical protein
LASWIGHGSYPDPDAFRAHLRGEAFSLGPVRDQHQDLILIVD